ncbi:MAG: hypothetical protein A3H88_00440 [Candidatus Blackburnbacteria bacterium RIFCSPLOWO2_02_FULL_44_9]|nr:MAG: hypothetical protein A3H88_00440 [Candidatus Blackburnbacteria bacterium RIFCSPLOWO2_02_FULL_44_9]
MNAPPTWLLYLTGVLILWLLGISAWVYRVASHYSRLVKGSGKDNLKDILERLLVKSDDLRDDLSEIKDKVKNIELKIQNDLQKVGVVKFNSFGDTGGNQSFALALLDGNNSGIIVLSLHGREGTRVYVKTITRGKSSHDLSKEEQQALAQVK